MRLVVSVFALCIGHHCWATEPRYYPFEPIGLKQECRLNKGQLECWGRGFIDAPEKLQDPTQFAFGGMHYCYLEAGRAKCFGDYVGGAPGDINFTELKLGRRSQICGLAEDQFVTSGFSTWLLPLTEIAGFNKIDGCGKYAWVEFSDRIENWYEHAAKPHLFDKATINNLVNPNNSVVEYRGPDTDRSYGDEICYLQGNPSSAYCKTRDGATYEVPGPFTQLKAAYYGFCGAKHNEIVCWRSKSDAEAWDFPPIKLTAPQIIGVGDRIVCARGREGVRCAGRLNDSAPDSVDISEFEREDLIAFGNMSSHDKYFISLGMTYCGATKSKVFCRGYPYTLDFIDSKTLSAVAFTPFEWTGAGEICVLDHGELKCFRPADGARFELEDGPIGRAEALAIAPETRCVMDDEIRCWRKYSGKDPFQAHPKLNNPQQIAIHDSIACALDGDGVKCWGLKDDPRPPLFVPIKDRTLLRAANGKGDSSGAAVCAGRWISYPEDPIDAPPLAGDWRCWTLSGEVKLKP